MEHLPFLLPDYDFIRTLSDLHKIHTFTQMYLRTSCGYILLLVQKSGKRIDADGFRFREIDMQGRTDSLNLSLSLNRCIARRIVFYDAFNRYFRIFLYIPDDVFAIAFTRFHNYAVGFYYWL